MKGLNQRIRREDVDAATMRSQIKAQAALVNPSIDGLYNPGIERPMASFMIALLLWQERIIDSQNATITALQQSLESQASLIKALQGSTHVYYTLQTSSNVYASGYLLKCSSSCLSLRMSTHDRIGMAYDVRSYTWHTMSGATES